MNITSAVVATAIFGMAAPGIANMAIQPMLAQQRANNFGEAEAAAVQFAAVNEGQTEVDMKGLNEDLCELDDHGNRSFTVKCSSGEGQFVQSAERSFRLEVESTYTNPERAFAWTAPLKYSHVECPSTDPWGVMWYNDHLKAGHLDACIPAPVWSEDRYLASNPDDWLYDLTDHGYGRHPDF
jgi:hypothetical protein